MNYNDLFLYKDGKLFWKISRRGLINTREVGTINKGYRWVKSDLLPKQTSVHRIIWEMHNGPIPERMVIDHINRNTLDNKIENLRLASRSQNSMNAQGKAGRKYQFPRNVYKDFEYNGKIKYKAQVCVNGETIRIGGFDTIEAAQIAAINLVKKSHGEFSFIDVSN